ncbi:MAG: endonuclease/exonuclease/phosphatase family protein [Candidatus Hodarchaeales archaeon]|jgi:endonuclease/exonuclease/phosphatase family metal-dependent hydrolase
MSNRNKKQIRVMTFNIKNSLNRNNTNLVWDNRKQLVLDIILKFQPDFLGLQEVIIDQLEFFKSHLSNYEYFGVGRDDGRRSGEFVPIFFKNFQVEDKGTFWLSDTPDICSNTWGGCYRVCTWISGKEDLPFVILNTHLDEKNSQTRLKSLKLILERVKRDFSNRNLILMGDFNLIRNSDEYRYLKKYLKDTLDLKLSFLTKFLVTSHDFRGSAFTLRQKEKRHLIDFIFYSGEIKPIKHQIITKFTKTRPNVYPSDHWPVISVFEY